MGSKSKIEWCDATWNALYGCSRVSEGCLNCYAERHIHRFSGPGQRHEGLTVIRGGRPGWTGKIQLKPQRLDLPLRWKYPMRIFVNSLSDLFHENVPFEYIAATYGVMAAAQRHQFQLLTKRPERAVEFFKWLAGWDCSRVQTCIDLAIHQGVRGSRFKPAEIEWPLKNVWLGVSAEDQATYNERVLILSHQCEASVRWVSLEPLLGPIELRGTGRIHIDWVVAGGESGRARPMDAAWVKALQEECAEVEIPFHFKQWGKIGNNPDKDDPTAKENLKGGVKGGRMLDGRTWDEEPRWLSST